MTPRQDFPPPPSRPYLPRNVSKLSILSPARSNEADDERSLSDHSSDMDSTSSRPHYEDEDTSLTSNIELAGFYMYGWAAEVFVVCGIGSFIPVTLEQLARENGVLLSDRLTPCKASLPTVSPSSLTTLFNPHADKGQCVVYILGLEINTASFAMYTFSISVLIQALLIISMSGAADHGRFRKTFLLWFAFAGSTATMLFIGVVPRIYILGAVLAIVANTCFGASFVLLNSFLPLLVRFHPTVKYADSSAENSSVEEDEDEDVEDFDQDEESDDGRIARRAHYANDLSRHDDIPDEVADATTALLPNLRSAADLTIPRPKSRAAPSPELALSTKISSYGIAIGYIAALLVQTISIVVVIAFKSSNLGLRVVLFIIGAWWAIFTLPAAQWLRARPGPPLSIGSSTSKIGTAFAYFKYSWNSLARTATHARHLKDVLLFLAAWFLLSDSIATVSGTAVLFAKTTLGMSYAMLALINVIATVFGVLGAFLWSRLAHFFRLTPTQTIMLCIALFEVIPLYGLLGYLPPIRRLGYLGLQQQWEMYPLGAVYGFVLGGLSSYCRALFGELIPPGHEAAFYALYAITDKGSSVFGPAIVGAITDACGEIRPAFWFLALLIGLPFPIMLLVDVDRGRREGVALAHKLEKMASCRRQLDAGDDGAADEQDDNLSDEVTEDLQRSFSYQRS
ncbi:MFS general substrate transporter [Dothidotthia symphoricarpi CBS 119687]|uniref:Autophagy-related protein n=1 Tax=Dothidotthia symphoricarpi CBS 119687 TaxID=1392245 RepID=A0A6A6AHP6_9PLEO|nr:MFS general substrate transporter [Dothidotthia symphoricarpi CBS 119687]KAF2129951.1 MFS general substrate transporter [Dothidotthia symphoricarpi CBS 119687]